MLNYLRFKRQYGRHNLNKNEPNIAPQNYAKDLLRDGCVLISNFIEKTKVEEIRGSIEPFYENQLVSGKGGLASEEVKTEDYFLYPNAGVFRFDATSKVKLKNGQTLDGYIKEKVDFCTVFDSYLSGTHLSNVFIKLTRFEVAFGLGAESIADTWHFDHWKPRLKTFLYLTDVDETNCPFSYVLGSNGYSSNERFYRNLIFLRKVQGRLSEYHRN